MSRGVVFRADGSSRIGLGHLYRCLSITEYLRTRGHVVGLVTFQCPDTLAARFENLGAIVKRLPPDLSALDQNTRLREFAAALNARVIVTDLWPVSSGAIVALRRELEPFRLACLDSGCLDSPVAHAVIRATVPEPDQPTQRAAVGFYQGPRYFPLRQSLLRYRSQVREIAPRVRRLVVTMGGGDARGATLRILDYLVPFSHDLHVDVIAGPAFPFLDDLQQRAAAHAWITISESPHEPAHLFCRADLCVTAAGFTLYELAFLGVPALALATEDHQLDNVRAFEASGTVVGLGHIDRLNQQQFAARFQAVSGDPVRRASLSEAGRRLMDGRGAERIADILENL